MNKPAITKFLAEEMGWKIKTDSHGRDYFTEDYFPTISKYRWVSEFDPFNDIAHAWMIVEWTMEHKPKIIDEIVPEYKDSKWGVTYFGSNGYWEVALGETAPGAITLAAVRALASPDQAKELWGYKRASD